MYKFSAFSVIQNLLKAIHIFLFLARNMANEQVELTIDFVIISSQPNK